MRKNHYLSLLAATLLLGLGSCSNDELANETQTSGDATVTFSVSAPSDMRSRAFADGTTATELTYAVYDKTGKYLNITGTETMSGLKASVSLSLATDNTYKVVFFAQKANTYTLDLANATMTVPTAVNNNDESLDAFFKTEEITLTGDLTQTVELRRPFAQLNIGTDDIATAQTSGMAVAKTEVKVTSVPTTLNFLDGTTSGSADVTYTAAAVPTGETFPVKGYEYLSMDYILMSADKATTDVTLTVDGTQTHTYASVPVQRNYRTNIYGSLLTSTAKFNVEIKPEFNFDKPDYGVSETANVTTVDELTTAIANGETHLVLAAGTYTLPNTLDVSKKMTIKGATGDPTEVTVVFEKEVYGGPSNNANITFQDVTVDRTQTAVYTGHFQHSIQENYTNCIIKGFIMLYVSESATFTNCVFNNTANQYAVQVYSSGAKVTFNKCEFNATMSKAILIYNEVTAAGTSKQDVTVNDCTFSATFKAKAAIQIHTEMGGLCGTVNINNCKVLKGFTATNGGLWQELNNSSKTETYYFDIYVDGTKVHSAQ